MKRISITGVIGVMALLLAMPLAIADTSIVTNVTTTEDVYSETTINSNGSVSIVIDGTNYPDVLDDLSGKVDGINDNVQSQLTMSDLVHAVGNVFDYLNGIVKYEPPHQWIELIIQLDRYFASDYDLNEKISQLESTNEMLYIRIEALERTVEKMNGTLYCEKKVQVIQDYGIESVKCGDTTYYNGDPVIGVTPINTKVDSVVQIWSSTTTTTTTTTLPPSRYCQKYEGRVCTERTQCCDGMACIDNLCKAYQAESGEKI